MRRTVPFLAVALALGTTAVFAFPAEIDSALSGLKVGKAVPIETVAEFMRLSERWCYNETDGACGWTDIYLSVDADGATYEIANAWSEDVDVAFVDHGVFRDGRFICETGFDWVPSVRATRRADGSVIGGRELAALRDEIASYQNGVQDCFDYEYRGSDSEAGTITLLQRQYDESGETDPLNDAEVTLHFDATSAAELGLYY